MVTDAQGKRVYYYKGKNLETYRFERNFVKGMFFIQMSQNKEKIPQAI